MKTVKSTVKAFAGIVRFAAESGGGGASWFGYCQPKEPAKLKKKTTLKKKIVH